MSGLKGESLLSNISNLSYHMECGVSGGFDFFKESLPFGMVSKEKKEFPKEEIEIGSLGVSGIGTLRLEKEAVGAFTVCWTNDMKNEPLGVSDQ